LLEHDLFRKPVSTPKRIEDARERAYGARPVCDGLWTRANALMIKSGAGFFRDMRQLGASKRSSFLFGRISAEKYRQPGSSPAHVVVE
jgi:hypothetical protein